MNDALPQLKAEYMFGLLGYSTWNLYRDKEFVAQLTLNEADRSVIFTPGDSWSGELMANAPSTWAQWMKWLRRNRHDPL